MNKAFESNINPIYNTFSKHVNSLIVKDQTKDLELYLEESTTLQYSSENEHAFIKKPTVPLPGLLTSFLKQPGINCKLGSLTSINHVWLCTKNSLFLWNLNNKDADIFRYDSSEPIENVEIIDLPSHKELLVSTENNIYLHAINQEDPKKIKLVSRNTTRSFGAVMSNVITSNTGRVFMKGSDGHLYELLLKLDANDTITYCALVCRTLNRLLYYLPSIFKSRPTEGVRSFVLDDKAKFLFLLLSDSSICAVNVQGDQYLPYYKYTGKDLESIHLVSSEKDKSKFIAISNKGDRLHFIFEEPAISLQYTRPAPPISGSLLFNRLSNESVDLSFYSQGVIGNVLGKSERSYLVLTSADIVPGLDGAHLLIEDVYHEQQQHKIWVIFENTTSSEFKVALKSRRLVNQPISVLTESGITQYIKQTPVEYLEEALSSNSSSTLVNVINRYGSLETTYLAYLLACSSQQPQKANEFIRQSTTKEDSLLLYFTRIVGDLWNMDIKHITISNDELILLRTDLKVLLNTIYNSQVPIKEEITELISRSIEGISFICFLRELNWDDIIQQISKTQPGEITFADFLTTNRGSIVMQDIVFTAIENSQLSNSSNKYSYIGNFLYENCLALLGSDTTIYLKAIECLHTAQYLKEDKKQATRISLQHLLTISSSVELARIASISQKYCELEDYDNAVALAFAKYASGSASLSDIHDILFSAIKQALDTDSGHQVVVKALSLSKREECHFEIYKWLLEHYHKELLISLETISVVPFIKTQMSSQAESLAYLEAYYSHRKQFSASIECSFQLATEAEGISLKERVYWLKKASGDLPMADNLEKQTANDVQRSLDVAEIQLQMFDALAEASSEAATQLDQVLFSENELLERFAYTHSLYEEALLLLDLMDIYNWNYVKDAWNHIIKTCSHETKAKEKVKNLADKMYPSIASFPVYTIYQILNRQYNKKTAESILQDAGVPHAVVSDAEKTVN